MLYQLSLMNSLGKISEGEGHRMAAHSSGLEMQELKHEEKATTEDH